MAWGTQAEWKLLIKQLPVLIGKEKISFLTKTIKWMSILILNSETTAQIHEYYGLCPILL